MIFDSCGIGSVVSLGCCGPFSDNFTLPPVPYDTSDGHDILVDDHGYGEEEEDADDDDEDEE